MKIVRVSTSKKGYGGNIYEEYIDRALTAMFPGQYEVVSYQFHLSGIWRILEAPLFLWFSWRMSRRVDQFVIRNFYTSFFPFKNRRRGITIVYHVDSAGSPLVVKVFQNLVEWLFFFRRDHLENILVIANYWRDEFVRRGYHNVSLIHCPYELERYAPVPRAEIEEFKVRHGLNNGKPIVFIGNPQVKKGAELVFAALQHLDIQMVTSGVGASTLPARHLHLGFSEYLMLLRASSLVVTLSQFKEGWCRVAHEAMLCGTPVIGSGLGGMAELLRLGGQLECRDVRQLESLVLQVLDHPPPIARGNLVRGFGTDDFAHAWKNIFVQLEVLPASTPRNNGLDASIGL